MSTRLYNGTDGVTILTDKDFRKGKIVSTKFSGPGVLKVYAPWCGHCQNKVQGFKGLAVALKKQGTGLVVYVVNADDNKGFSKMFNIQGFPTMLFVGKDGSVKPLADAGGNPVYDIPGIVGTFCRDYQKMCNYQG